MAESAKSTDIEKVRRLLAAIRMYADEILKSQRTSSLNFIQGRANYIRLCSLDAADLLDGMEELTNPKQDRPVVKPYSERNHYEDKDGCFIVSGGWCCHTSRPLKRCRARVLGGTCPKQVKPRTGDLLTYAPGTWGC